MDIESQTWDQPPESGGVRCNRLIAVIDGHTHIYQYPDDEQERATWIIREHVADGRLHPYAGLMLLMMVGRDDE
jgi:hypothetical protein